MNDSPEVKHAEAQALCRPQQLNKAVLNSTGVGIDVDEALDIAGKSPVVQQEETNPMPISSTVFKCEVGEVSAGSYNVSVLLPKGIAANGPAISSTIFRDGHGTPYNVQVFAQVHSVHPSLGSLAGGTTLEIRGSGFSEALDQISVSASGQNGTLIACDVLESTFTSITCVTRVLQAGNDTNSVAATNEEHPDRCHDYPGWYDGNWGCAQYAENEVCGGSSAWKAVWGSASLKTDALGFSAFDACCACGGGNDAANTTEQRNETLEYIQTAGIREARAASWTSFKPERELPTGWYRIAAHFGMNHTADSTSFVVEHAPLTVKNRTSHASVVVVGPELSSLGNFYFVRGGIARVTADITRSAGELQVEAVTFEAIDNDEDSLPALCTDVAAANFDREAMRASTTAPVAFMLSTGHQFVMRIEMSTRGSSHEAILSSWTIKRARIIPLWLLSLGMPLKQTIRLVLTT